jgi:pimeloyl-ACP methyl ester carboxylesterase
MAVMALPTLLMLPGSLCDARVFDAQSRSLRRGFSPILADYRKLQAGTQWVDALLADMPPRFSVAGFSLGGLWALEMLRRAPQRIERMALIASNAQSASERTRRSSKRLWRQWCSRGPEAVVQQLKPAYFHHQSMRRKHAPVIRDMALRTPRRAVAAEFSWAAHRPAGHHLLADFRGPLLLVSGERDRLCPPAWQQAILQAQPAARWVCLPRVGHFVPLEAPAALRDALLQWMRC